MKNLSLKTQVAAVCVVFTVLLTAAIGISGFFQYRRNITRKYHDYAGTIVRIAEYAFTENDMLNLVRTRSMDEKYDRVRDAFNAIKERSDIAYIFGIFFEDTDDINSLCFVINGARTEELEGRAEEEVYSFMGEPCSEGDFDEAMRRAYLESYLSGSEELYYYDNVTEEYGHMLTCYKVLHDASGEPVCILSVDVDVNDIRANLTSYIVRMVAIALGVMLVLLLILLWMVGRSFTDPVMRIAKSTDRYVKLLNSNAQPENLVYEAVKPNSGKDLVRLSENVEQMAVSVKDYMIHLQAVTKDKERIGAELELAAQIQADMLPRIFPPFPDRGDLDIYASMTPAKEVGGDFYDFFFADEDHLVMVMADVSGKGVPAALFMVIAKTLIKNQFQHEKNYSPAAVLETVNTQLCEGNDAELFVTVWLAVFNVRTGEGKAANAGHEHPAVRRAGGNYELVKYRHSPAVAVMEGMHFREHEFRLAPGDSLFVYTDGVTEASNAANELFGEKRLVDALNLAPEAGPSQLIYNVQKEILSFVGNAPQFDDITMLAFLYNGPREEKREDISEEPAETGQ